METKITILTDYLDDHEAEYFKYLLDELDRIGCIVIKK